MQAVSLCSAARRRSRGLWEAKLRVAAARPSSTPIGATRLARGTAIRLSETRAQRILTWNDIRSKPRSWGRVVAVLPLYEGRSVRDRRDRRVAVRASGNGDCTCSMDAVKRLATARAGRWRFAEATRTDVEENRTCPSGDWISVRGPFSFLPLAVHSSARFSSNSQSIRTRQPSEATLPCVDPTSPSQPSDRLLTPLLWRSAQIEALPPTLECVQRSSIARPRPHMLTCARSTSFSHYDVSPFLQRQLDPARSLPPPSCSDFKHRMPDWRDVQRPRGMTRLRSSFR